MDSVNIKEINEKIKDESAFIDLLTTEMNKVIVGQKQMIDRLLIGLLGNGHILLEGVPGLAKTLAINTLSKAVDGDFSRIQFTPDLLPADVVGTMIYNMKENLFEIKKGPIVICPPNKNAKNLFKYLGEVVEIKNEKLSNKFWATASIMAAYYEILNVSSNWLIKKGINKTIANNYISELFLSLSQDAVNKRSQGFKKLVADSQTPKGLNMQVLNKLKRGKFYNKFITTPVKDKK